MIDQETRVLKLIDFGEACICDINGRKINANGIHGSTPYIAPEEFINKDYDPQKVDIWSIGIILYEITYLKIPWTVANDTDKRYIKYKKVFKDDLLELILPKLKQSDLLYVPHKLFRMLLDPEPESRSRIQEIKTTLLEIGSIN
jgi:protein-serine/threonine kinase